MLPGHPYPSLFIPPSQRATPILSLFKIIYILDVSAESLHRLVRSILSLATQFSMLAKIPSLSSSPLQFYSTSPPRPCSKPSLWPRTDSRFTPSGWLYNLESAPSSPAAFLPSQIPFMARCRLSNNHPPTFVEKSTDETLAVALQRDYADCGIITLSFPILPNNPATMSRQGSSMVPLQRCERQRIPDFSPPIEAPHEGYRCMPNPVSAGQTAHKHFFSDGTPGNGIKKRVIIRLNFQIRVTSSGNLVPHPSHPHSAFQQQLLSHTRHSTVWPHILG